MQVKWHDGTAIWVPLNALKESHPVEVAEYAVTSNQIAEEPAFAWRARNVLHKRDRIMSQG